jgi:D-tyrosyl-tRNA(Tyr) deacylase
MKAVIQRVSRAQVEVSSQVTGRIGRGLVILLGARAGDDEKEVDHLADKCAQLRIFEDDQGKMNLSLLEVGGEALIISQFTLYGDSSKGRRPSFTSALEPEKASSLYDRFVEAFRQKGVKTETGIFGARMKVELVNDGPVTFIVTSKSG